MNFRRLTAVPVALAMAFVALSMSGAPTRAGTALNYPADCPASIQQCVDMLPGNGDTVYVHADDAGPGVSINKSLSVKSINATKYRVGYFSIFDLDPSPPIFVTVAGLTVNLFVRTYLNSSTGSAVNVRGMVVNGQPGQASTVSLDAETSASYTLEDSVLHGQNNANVVGLLVVPNGGNINVRVAGNRIDAHGKTASGAGIQLNTLSSGTAKVDIYNNVVWDVARGLSGADSGMAILPSGTVQSDVNLVGNTIELSATDGIQQRNSMAAGGRLNLDMFNNTISHSGSFGASMTKGLPGTVVLRAGFNNYFANADGNSFNGLPAGSNNKQLNPKFVNRAAGDLRLTSASGLINIGQVCSPGGVTNPDAANRTRLAGKSVDIGAYERGAQIISGLVVLGTGGADNQVGSAGADILCGYAGIDFQTGMAGNDYIDGGTERDTLIGGSGLDRMLGGGGPDTLCANDGAPGDFINGGGGTDSFKADSGDTRKSVENAAACT